VAVNPSAPELAIDVRGLTKRYGARTVVDAIDLQVPRGSICGFLGPNGSGKTTTIRMLCGLLKANAGTGRCLGLDIATQATEIKRQVGYMTQKFGLYDDLTIRENLDFVARLFELPERRSAVDTALARLGLVERQAQLAGTLSGGWKQRLALSACLLHAPQLLLLDEPTAGVDPKARREFWDEIHRLAAQGITVLVSTHYMDEAERCHRLAYIAYGTLMASGTAQEIVASQQLTTWAVSGDGLQGLGETLRQLPGVDLVASFGATLHVSGKDGGLLEASLGEHLHGSGLQMTAVSASLEDAFIYLMQGSQDQFRG
jgi:ABC-2 type transport system ATP-binding protein